jgi:ribosomal protein S18 acetylase RimI-like enzyme
VTTTSEIRRATPSDAKWIAPLFDRYRQFYERPSNLALAESYIYDRLKNDESAIFVAHDGADTCLGFTQLYRTFCSVSALPLCVLYDLFVEEGCRQRGIARDLMTHAYAYALDIGAGRLELKTANTNQIAQRLYDSLGWEREERFVNYRYALKRQ